MAGSADISEPWGTIQMCNTGKFLYADLMDSCGIKSMRYHRGGVYSAVLCENRPPKMVYSHYNCVKGQN